MSAERRILYAVCFLCCGLAGLMMACGTAHAASIVLRTEVTCQNEVVTLGDVAVITPYPGEKIDALKNVVLFPLPLAGRNRTVSYREIVDILRTHQIPVGNHAFSGAGQVIVIGVYDTGTATQSTTSRTTGKSSQTAKASPGKSGTIISQEEEMVKNAVLTFLRQNVDSEAPWQVAVALSQKKQQEIARAGQIIGIRAVVPESLVAASDPSVTPNGSNDLWLGRQKFELQCEQVSRQTGANPVVAVEANVSLPPKMVVTRHAIPRGKIITAADVSVNYVQTPVRPENVTTKRTINGVTTTRDNKTELDPDVATTLEEVVGKTPAKTFGAGMPLMVSQLQMPILVKRAETVSVYVRNDGIVIKTLGIAKQDAKSGDLIAVESIQNKKTFLARAVDLGTVEIETQRSPATGAFETVAPERTASIQNNQTY